MTHIRFPWKQVSDDEYVDRIRNSIAFWERWRIWFVLLYAGLFVAVIWMLPQAIQIVVGIVAPANAPLALLGFSLGVTIGLTFGWMLHTIIHGAAFALGGFRTERLLLRSYKPVNANPLEGDCSLEDASGFEENE